MRKVNAEKLDIDDFRYYGAWYKVKDTIQPTIDVSPDFDGTLRARPAYSEDETDYGVYNQLAADATTPDPTWQPPVGKVYEIYAMRLLASGLAGNREGDLSIQSSGGLSVYIWRSGAAAILSNSDYSIYPWDESTLMTGAADIIGVPPLVITRNHILSWDTTGLAGAETMRIYAYAVTKNV